MTFEFWLVDAFSAEPYRGNLAAVVFGAHELPDASMQAIARHLNLSETVFFCPPTVAAADYRVRIFTPRSEVPFAGHPTIASAFAHLTRNGMDPKETGVLRQECGIGVIQIDVTGPGAPLFTMRTAGSRAKASCSDSGRVAELLSLPRGAVADEPVEVCSVGLPWTVARVGTLSELTSANPDLPGITALSVDDDSTGLTVYCLDAESADCSVHVRSFGPRMGIPEDPTCGSGNAAVAVHLSRHAYRDLERFSYRAEQGLEMSRLGVLHLTVTREQDEGALVRLGGQATRMATGTLDASGLEGGTEGTVAR